MHPLKTLRTMFAPKRKIFDPLANIDAENVGWHKSGSTSSAYSHYKSSDYENAYPSVNKIANAFMMIEPFTIDENGKQVDSPVLDRLYTPNATFSAADFREALAVMTLVHKKVYLQVHHTGSKVTPNNITGFTFMEGALETIIDGKSIFQLPDGTKLDSSEVITLKNINPDDLSDGFSPTYAARRWISLDDYISTYQNGFFANGAVPQGQFVITARTAAEFNDIVDNMEAHHKGAGKNNGVTYAHRAVAADGKPQDANIEWIPFNTSNRELALDQIFKQVNQKIDSVYGVPASIRGVNDNNTYASVRVDEVIFAKYVVDPIALKIYSKLTHELNRITGGLGVAFDYELDIPQVADEEKVKAEAKSLEQAIIDKAIAAGYTMKSIVEAYDLDPRYLRLKLDPNRPAPVAAVAATVPAADQPQVTPAGDTTTPPPPDTTKKTVTKKMDANTRADYEQSLYNVVYEQTAKMVDAATAELDSSKSLTSKAIEPNKDEMDAFVAAMLTVILPLVALEGAKAREDAMALLLVGGINTDKVLPFELTPAQKADYAAYLQKVGKSYTTTTAEGLRAILQRGHDTGLSASQMKQQLQGYLQEDWRIRRVTATEINRSGTNASVDAMKNIADQTGAKIDKIWTHGGGDKPCEFCQEMIGTVVDVTGTFVAQGGKVTTADGHEYINDFHPVDSGSLHPSCHCLSTYRVRK